MTATRPKRLNPLDCIAQAEDCRRMARIAEPAGPQRVMMDHIADTWERIAADIDRQAAPPMFRLH